MSVVFLETLGQGHINPTIPLVKALSSLYEVTYFADDKGPEGLDYVNEDTPLGRAIMDAGGTLRKYRLDRSLDEDPRLEGLLNARWKKLPPLLNDLRSLNPSVIVYDCFNPVFLTAARILGCPHVALVPHSGPGTMAASEGEGNKEKMKGVREWLRENYSIDLFSLGVPASSWYSKDANIVLTSRRMYAPMCTSDQKKLWNPDIFHCVGTLYDRDRRSLHPKLVGFPMEYVKRARDDGRRVVLLSLGSVVTDRFFDAPLGRVIPSHIEDNDDGTRVMDGYGRILRLGDMTGRDFMHFVFRQAFQALGGDRDYLVVVVCGRRGVDEVLKELRDPASVSEEEAGRIVNLPENFLAVDKVPQVRQRAKRAA